ncbi:MAG: hypothetical protein ACLFVU_10105, partial [Phycisphaerae bacterium]
LFTPLLIRHLGEEGFGIWRLVFSLVSSFFIVQLGLNSAVNREVACAHALKKPRLASELVCTTLGVYLVGAAIVFAFTLVLAWKFPVWFDISEENALSSRIAVAIAGCVVATVVPLGVFRAVLTGLQRYVEVNSVKAMANLLRAAAVGLVLLVQRGVVELVAMTAGMVLLENLLIARLSRKAYPEIRLSRELCHPRALKPVLWYSLSSIMFGIGGMLNRKAGLWLIGIMVGAAGSSPYAVAMSLCNIIVGVVTFAVAGIKPAAAALDASEDTRRLEILLVRSLKYTFFVAIPFSLLLYTLGGNFLLLWLRKPAFLVVVPALQFMCITQVLYMAQFSGSLALLGVGRHRAVGATTILSVPVGIGLSLLLRYYMEDPYLAVSIGMGLPTWALGLVVVPLLACHAFKASRLLLYREAFARPVLVSLPAVGLCWLIVRYVRIDSWLSLMMAGAGISLTAAVCYLAGGMDGLERKALLSSVLRRKRKARMDAEEEDEDRHAEE